jgi:exopolysaccharide biosynthesis WecB/TagA/CpsF family protein
MNIVSSMAVFSSNRPVLGLPVCDLNWADAFMFVSALVDMPIGQTVISFLNAHNCNVMLNDPVYRETLERHLVLPDGIGVDIASMLTNGSRFPANLNGTDFVPALLTYIATPKRIGLIGARPEALKGARDAFARHAPWHEFVAVHDGFFTEEETPAIMADVARQKFDILLVAMGTPKQEIWVDRYVRPEHARLVISVGALFDFMAGIVPRAPHLVRQYRVEWLYRVLQEPRRLAGRYFVGGPVFLGRIFAHAARLHASRLVERFRPKPPVQDRPRLPVSPRRKVPS